MSGYIHTDPIPCDVDVDASTLKGKTAVVTGGMLFSVPDDENGLQKPDLKTIDVNLNGVLYTTRLSLHNFVKQNGQTPSEQQEHTCLILIGSGAAFLDVARTPQYEATKWAVRGIMHSLRRTAHFYGSRVSIISPWYVKTKILSEEAFEHVKSKGVDFATVEDAGQCLLRILSDREVNVHSFFLSPRKWASRGYVDFELEDYEDELLKEVQKAQLKGAPPEDGLFM